MPVAPGSAAPDLAPTIGIRRALPRIVALTTGGRAARRLVHAFLAADRFVFATPDIGTSKTSGSVPSCRYHSIVTT